VAPPGEGTGVTRCAIVIAIVGAESSGKTTLAAALHGRLVAEGRGSALVAEALREFCDREGRTPRRDEQAGLAAEQTRRIEAAAREHEFVVADTTALMTAVYSELLFSDCSLYPAAEAAHRRCDLTLLTALDLPWQADGLQRDGAHVRAPVDALLRGALMRMQIGFGVVAGQGEARTEAAWRALRHRLAPAAAAADPAPRWHCERCGDPDCERRLFALAPRLARGG
jgi:nicotinamide riboside kinase